MEATFLWATTGEDRVMSKGGTGKSRVFSGRRNFTLPESCNIIISDIRAETGASSDSKVMRSAVKLAHAIVRGEVCVAVRSEAGKLVRVPPQLLF